MATVGVKGLIQ